MKANDVTYGYDDRKGYFAQSGKGLDAFRIYSREPEGHSISLERAKRRAKIQEIACVVIMVAAAIFLLILAAPALLHILPFLGHVSPIAMSYKAVIISVIVAITLGLGAYITLLSYKEMQEKIAQMQEANMEEVTRELEAASVDSGAAAEGAWDDIGAADGIIQMQALPPGRPFEIEDEDGGEVVEGAAYGRERLVIEDDEEETIFERDELVVAGAAPAPARLPPNPVEPAPSEAPRPAAPASVIDWRPQSPPAPAEVAAPVVVPLPVEEAAPVEPVARPPSPPVYQVDRRPQLLVDDPDSLSEKLYRPQLSN